MNAAEIRPFLFCCFQIDKRICFETHLCRSHSRNRLSAPIQDSPPPSVLPCRHNEKGHTFLCVPFLLYQQLPILPGRFQPSTFGVYELNYRVRHGYGCFLIAVATESLRAVPSKLYRRKFQVSLVKSKLRPRSISTASLHSLQNFHSRPIYLIVYKGSYSLP